MADKNINIHVRAKDTERTKQAIDRVSESTEKMGRKVDQGGRDGSRGLTALNDSAKASTGLFGRLQNVIGNFATRIGAAATAVAALTAALRINKAALEEHADITEKQEQKASRLKYLGGSFRTNPRIRKEIEEDALFGRRSFEEVAEARYNLESQTSELSKEQQRALLREALELGLTDKDAPLSVYTNMFTLFAKKSGQADANRIQNTLLETITQAGGTAGDVGKYMTQFLPIGMSGGLTAAQAAGLWSYVTTQSADAASATTGLEAVFMGLQGQGTAEGDKLLKRLGIDKDMGFFGKIGLLAKANAEGNFSLADAQRLAGVTGSSTLLSILQKPQSMVRTVGKVMAADVGDKDFTREMITELHATDKEARLKDQIDRNRIAIELDKGNDEEALERRAETLDKERRMRENDTPETMIKLRLWYDDLMYHTTLPAFRNLQDASGAEGVGPVTNNYNYGNTTIYSPRVGDDERGPRSGPDDI